MTLKSDSLAIIVPAYNEEKGLDRCIKEILIAIENISDKAKLVVVNDGSKDMTAEIIKAHPVVVGCTHKTNQGYGAALRTGIKKAQELKLTWCLFMDSDLTNDPKYISEFVKAMSQRVDCVKASRYMPGGKMVGVPIKRQVISKVGNLVAVRLFNIGINDCTNGFRMARTKLLAKIPYAETGFVIIMEELFYLKKLGARFTEIPTTLSNRANSKTNFHYTAKVFWTYLRYALKAAFIT